jgi:hypothetical protein
MTTANATTILDSKCIMQCFIPAYIRCGLALEFLVAAGCCCPATGHFNFSVDIARQIHDPSIYHRHRLRVKTMYIYVCCKIPSKMGAQKNFGMTENTRM